MSEKPDNQDVLDALGDFTDDSDDVMYEQDAHNVDADLGRSGQNDIETLVLTLEHNTGLDRLSLAEFINVNLDSYEVQALSGFAKNGQGVQFIKVMQGVLSKVEKEDGSIEDDLYRWVSPTNVVFKMIGQEDDRGYSVTGEADENTGNASSGGFVAGDEDKHDSALATPTDLQQVAIVLNHNTGIDIVSVASFVRDTFDTDTIHEMAEYGTPEASSQFFEAFWKVMDGFEADEESTAFYIATWAGESGDELKELSHSEYQAAAMQLERGADDVELDFDIDGSGQTTGLFGLTEVQRKVYGVYLGVGLVVLVLLGGMGTFFFSRINPTPAAASNINYGAFDFVEQNNPPPASGSEPGVQSNAPKSAIPSAQNSVPQQDTQSSVGTSVQQLSPVLQADASRLIEMEGRLEDVIEESSRAFDAIESRLNLTIERDRTTASQLGTLNTSIQSIQRQLTRLNESASDYDNMIASIDSRVSELQAKLEQQSEDATASELSQPVSTPVRNAPSPERYAGTLQYCVLTAITGTAYVKSRRTGSAVRLERGTRLIGYGRITEIRANGDIVTRNPVNGSQMLVQRSCNY